MMQILNVRNILVLAAGMLLISSCQESKTARFERETQEFTKKNCPQVVNGNYKWIVLDSLVFHDDGSNNYISYYTVNSDSIDVSLLDQVWDDFSQELRRGVINSVELRHVKEAGLNILYTYRDSKTQKELAKFVFTKEDYE